MNQVKQMNYSVFRFTLDFHKHQSQKSIPVFLGDTAVRLLISLTDGGNAYTIENGCRAVLYGRKPGENPSESDILIHDCVIESNAVIRYDFTDQTANVAGVTQCELRLYGADGKLVTAPRFIIVVDERVVYDKDIPLSQTDLQAVDKIFAAVEDIEASANIARENATLAQNSEDSASTEANRAYEYAEDAKTAKDNAVIAKEAAEKAKGDAMQAYYDANNSANHAYDHLVAVQEAEQRVEQYAEQVGAGAAYLMADMVDSDFMLTFELFDAAGRKMSEASVDLPLESSITNIAYDEANKDLIFTLRNGNKTNVPLDDIVRGLATEAALNAGLAGKVNKLTAALKLYGTDSNGNQASYSIVGTTGDSTLAIMTQAAVTAALNSLQDRISELEKGGGSGSGGGGNVEIVQTDLANLNDRLTSFYLDDGLTIRPNSQEVVNGVYGWSGFSESTVSCVTRPMRVFCGEKITVSGNGLLIHCFLLKEDTFENNTILRGLTSTYTEAFTFEVPVAGYLIVDIKKTNGAQISTSEASAITITRKIEKNNLINLGLGLMTTDASGNFTVSNASTWNLGVFPVQVGKTYDLTLLTSYSSGSRVKWAFSSLPYYEVTKDVLNASNVVSHAQPIFTDNLQDKPTCISVTAPEGAKSLVLNSYIGSSIGCGDMHIIRYDDGGEERVVPQSAVYLDKSDIVKNATSAGGTVSDDTIILGGGKYYVLGTLVKTKAHSENIILRMTYRVERDATVTQLPSIYATFNNHFISTAFGLDNEEYMEGAWRFPAFGFVNDAMNIIVNVPEGNTLRIKNVKSEYSNVVYSHETGVRLTAHLGVYDFAPENTMLSYMSAHNLGYPSCVANPKITADGVFVCIHDDDISRTATNADGTEVAQGAILVSQSNYADLLQYDFGRKYNDVYKGAKIPKLDDFLFYCGKVGMKPVFSTHKDFTNEQWLEIKNMMIRYGILKSFTCKGGYLSLLESAYSVFQDEIEYYVYDTPPTPNIDEIISSLNNSSLSAIKDKVIIEMPSHTLTEADVTKILEAGYKAGAYDIFGLKGERYKEFIRWGITEFVDDRNCSYGLNW